MPGVPLTEEYAIWVAEHPPPAPPPTEPNREPPSWRAVTPTAVAAVDATKTQTARAEKARPVKKARRKVARVAVNSDDEEGAYIRPKRNRGLFQGLFGWGDDDDKPKKKKMKNNQRKNTASSRKRCLLFCG